MKKLCAVVNSFHGTEVKMTEERLMRLISLRNTHMSIWTKADKAFRYRIWNKLCGIKGCKCGDDFGIRF